MHWMNTIPATKLTEFAQVMQGEAPAGVMDCITVGFAFPGSNPGPATR